MRHTSSDEPEANRKLGYKWQAQFTWLDISDLDWVLEHGTGEKYGGRIRVIYTGATKREGVNLIPMNNKRLVSGRPSLSLSIYLSLSLSLARSLFLSLSLPHSACALRHSIRLSRDRYMCTLTLDVYADTRCVC
jgi:hypothetical protein